MEAIIGVVGTLLGTILGWLLARWNIGKLYISLDINDEKFYRLGKLGDVSPTSKGELYSVEFSFVIHLYNSFPINRAIRECELVFIDFQGKQLKRMAIDDKATRRYAAHATWYDSIGVVNISGYESKDIDAAVFLQDLDLLYKIAKIEFHYKNEKREKKRLKYKEISFANIPRVIE